MGPLKGLAFRFHELEDISPDFILGKWERSHFEFIDSLRNTGVIPKENAIICDIGANVGVYSAWFDRLYQGRCIVFAFEPSTTVRDWLSETIALNKCVSIRVVPFAVAEKKGNVTFYPGGHHSTGSMHQPGTNAASVTVDAIDLDSFFFDDSSHPVPHFMKIDIEGAGTHALLGMRRLVREAEPVILMDSHSVKEDAAIGSLLKENGWSAFRLDTEKWVEDHGATAPVENGVWGTMLLCSASKKTGVQASVDRKFEKTPFMAATEKVIPAFERPIPRNQRPSSNGAGSDTGAFFPP